MVHMSAYKLFKRASLKYIGKWLGHTLRYMDPSIDHKTYVLQSFEDELNYYTVSAETNGDGFVLSFDYSPDEPTPNLAECLQSLEVPSGYYLCYHDGHTNEWLLLHHRSKEEAKATYKHLYMKYFKSQIYMTIVKI